MGFSVGIVGLPNVGKSTLFKALTKKEIDISNYPFCTIDPNVGIVKVPDERLEKLANFSKSAKIIPTAIEFVDIAGLVKDAHKGEGLGNKFLANIREVDMIVHIVRGFEDGNITHVSNKIDPKDDMETINLELILADIETVNKRLVKTEKEARSGDKEAILFKSVLEKYKSALENEQMASGIELNKNEKIASKGFQLLTNKPILYVVNVNENQKIDKDNFYKYLKKFGLDELTGVEISGEVKGNLSNLEKKSDINYATASFGQGISVTPLAILAAISSFANDGKLMKPYIVDEFICPDNSSEKVKPKFIRRVVSAKTANLVSAMMVSVIDNGHAQQAKVDGYKFAGKTGTSQISKKEGRGYEKDKTIHTFVGFGPISNPKFSILVKLDSPKALYAANTTAYVFKDMVLELVSYYNIPPVSF